MSEAPSATTPQWSDSTRKAARLGAYVGFALVLVAVLPSSVRQEFSFGTAVSQVLVMTALVGFPPLFAFLSYPNRPLLLLPAGLMGIVSMYGISLFGLPMALLGVIWLWAYLRMSPPGLFVRKAAMVLVPLLWIGASTALWIHVDPVCEQHLADGTVRSFDPADRGFESGWTWDIPNTFSGSSRPISDEVVFEACSSNVVTGWEAAASLLILAGAAAGAIALATPTTSTSQAPVPAE